MTDSALPVFFSVIMPTYNRAFCIATAVDALLNQTYQNFELIIVDDGSTDATAELLKSKYDAELKSGKIVFLPQEKNAGVCAARNKGLEAAKYEWIAYADTDNCPRPNFLEIFEKGIRENNAECFNAKIFCTSSGEIIGEKTKYKKLLQGNQIDLGAFVHSKRLYDTLGGFDTSLTRYVDWDLVLTYTKKNPSVFLNEIVLDYNDSDDFQRITNSVKNVENFKKIRRKHLSAFARLFNVQKKSDVKIYTVFGVPVTLSRPLLSKKRIRKADPKAEPFKVHNPSKTLLFLSCLFCRNKEKRRALKAAYTQNKLNAMRIGVAYNLFDGEELLEASIRSIRDCVDYISVVYQTVSNYGRAANKGLEALLERLMQEGLIDEIYRYTPVVEKGGRWNENRKRNIGLEMAKLKKCSHFLSLDTDEFYIKSEFDNAKAFISKNDIDTTSSGVFGYVKSPCWRRTSPSPVDTPFIFKIKRSSRLGAEKYFPQEADPTRTVYPVGKFWRFSSNVLMLHHMNFVRKDFHLKYKNSSFNDEESTKYEKMLNRIEAINNYKGAPEDFEGSPVRDVGNIFNISF